MNWFEPHTQFCKITRTRHCREFCQLVRCCSGQTWARCSPARRTCPICTTRSLWAHCSTSGGDSPAAAAAKKDTCPASRCRSQCLCWCWPFSSSYSSARQSTRARRNPVHSRAMNNAVSVVILLHYPSNVMFYSDGVGASRVWRAGLLCICEGLTNRSVQTDPEATRCVSIIYDLYFKTVQTL